MSHAPHLPNLITTPTQIITTPPTTNHIIQTQPPLLPQPQPQPSLPPAFGPTSSQDHTLPDAYEANDFDDEELGEVQHDPSSVGRKRLFNKELRLMMYGFGDDQNPYTESVDLLEDLVIEFVTETTHRAMEIGRTGRVQVEDIIYLVRKDQRKYARVKDLLTMNEELKKARKAFDEIKYVGAEAKIK